MRNGVLFVCEGAQHLSSSIALAKHLKSIGIDPHLYYAHAFPDNPGLRNFKFLLNDILTVPGFLQNIGLVIFFTNESSPFCMVSNKISYIAKRTGTATVTVQHGWIQPALNYASDISKISFSGRGTDSSRALWHFSPVLKFFGEDGIGYPIGDHKANIAIPKKENINVLISTNFNWNVYSRGSIVGFLRSLITLKQNFPQLNLVHRPHPAESTQTMAAELGFYMEIAETTKGEWPDINSAIDWADVVISTPSTVVLDAYFRGVPSFVYKPETFESSLAQAEGISFTESRELIALMGGLLNKGHYSDPGFDAFNSERFGAAVIKLLKDSATFSLTEEDYLQFIDFCKL